LALSELVSRLAKLVRSIKVVLIAIKTVFVRRPRFAGVLAARVRRGAVVTIGSRVTEKSESACAFSGGAQMRDPTGESPRSRSIWGLVGGLPACHR
jgi:hypothetical protein